MRRLLAALAFAPLLSAACGGGGGGGSSPADAVAEGTITDTGSAAVTGTLFEFDADTEFDIDGVPDGGADDLAIGLQVRVEGERSGDTGTAHLVSFDDSLEGPVAAAVVIGDVKELTILGQVVVMEDGVTLFGPGASFGGIGVGLDVEVSGLRDGDGAIHATWVGLGSPTLVSLEGEVSGLSAGHFMIGSVDIFYDEDGVNTDLQGVPEGGLENGDFVDVLGEFQDPNIVHADLAPAPNQGVVELEERAISGSRGDVQREGIVAEFASVADFELDGQPVNAGRFGVEFEPDSLLETIGDGARIEVEGSVVNGRLVASVVKQRAGDVRIQAEVGTGAVDAVAGTLEMLGTTLEVDSSTRFFDPNDADFDALGDLAPGNLLDVRGIDLGAVVRPTEINRVAGLASVRVRGRVEQFSSATGTFAIAGVVLKVDTGTVYAPLFPAAVDTEAKFFTFLSGCPDALLDVTAAPDPGFLSIEFADRIELDASCTP